MKIYTDYNLLPHNTFGISARCQRFVQFESVADILAYLQTDGVPKQFIIVGSGSNLLLTGDYPGTVFQVDIRGIEVRRKETGDRSEETECLLRCGAGEVWDDVVAYCVAQNLHGAENLSLIPGTVGASAVQNIGAYGVEIKDLIERVEAVELATGRLVEFTNDDCQYAYRQSRFKQDWRNRFLITHVTYRLQTSFMPQLGYGGLQKALADSGIDTPTASQLREVIIAVRQSKLPDVKVLGNGGSFFVNPVVPRSDYERLAETYPDMPHHPVGAEMEKIPAAWLIQTAGWKGKNLGRAGVYQHQPLVLVNLGGATGGEILDLCQAIQTDVERLFGIRLKPEVNIV